MSAEKSQQLRRKYPCCQKRKDKAERIYSDQKEAERSRLCASRHQKHTRKRRSDARRPRKTKRESHDQCSDRRHGHLFKAQRNAVFFSEYGRISEHTKLIQSEQYDQHTADPRQKHPVFAEKAACRRCSQTEDEKGSADPQSKKQDPDKQFNLCSCCRCAGFLFFRSIQPEIQSS